MSEARDGAAAARGGPVADESAPWLWATDRKYGFAAEELARRLGLQGDKVIKVEFDASSQLWLVTAREET